MIRVRWEETSLSILADLWMRADSVTRQRITYATHQIDLILQADPENAGESREHGRRILFVPPLGVLFRVEDRGQTVWVIDVWQIRLRHNS